MIKPIFIWQDKTLQKINTHEVMFLYTEGNYTKICLSDDSYYLVRTTLANAMKILPPEIFIQTHRSYAVSVHFIETITKDHLNIGGFAIPISKQYFDRVLSHLRIIQ